MIKLIQGDCLEEMKNIEDGSVDLTVTSPPYDNLRTYNGNISQWNEKKWKDIIKELFRVTKQGGVVVWVVGDATIKGSETGTSFKQALYFKEVGFNLHDTMIYEKNGAAYPASQKSNRYSQIFEYMFIFSKWKPKTVNLLKDKLNKWGGTTTFGAISERQKDGIIKKSKKIMVQEFGFRENIWRINNGFGYSSKDKTAYEHPAIFPEQLANDHILSWSNKNDLVFDCFMGSGTTGKMAKLLNRNFIGIELDKNYYKIACDRINNVEEKLL